MTETTDLLRLRIRARLDETGLSEEAASRKAGLDKTYLRKFFEREGSSPRAETLARLAEALGTTVEALMRPGPALAQDVRPAPVTLPPREAMPNDVPVYGTAAASHLKGAFQLEPGVVDYVRRPPGLSAAREAYALFVEGTSMEPRFQPGDLLFVHPNRPPRAGDTVIVQVQVAPHEIEASVGFLRRTTASHVIIGKLNPDAEVLLPRQRVTAIHRVLSINELFGV